MSKKIHKVRGAVFLVMLLACSLVLNFFLARKVRSLQDYVHLMKAEGQLAVGTFVAPFRAKDLEGRSSTIDYRSNNGSTLLYVFTPGCEWCTSNLPNIKALASEVRSECRVVGLSLSSDNLREYAIKNNLNFPVYSELPFAVTSSYKLGGTPQTLLVSREGQVLKNWPGTYEGELQRELESYFSVRLPGLAGDDD